MCARATPPGGIVATFIESFVEPTFFALIPALYRMPFQPRQSPLPRMTWIPSPFSTYFLRSSSDSCMGLVLPSTRETVRAGVACSRRTAYPTELGAANRINSKQLVNSQIFGLDY